MNLVSWTSMGRRRDKRPLALALVAMLVTLSGLGIIYYPPAQQSARLWQDPLSSQGVEQVAVSLSASATDDPLRQQLDTHFQRAVVMLHAKQYQHALVALQQVLAIAPNLPEAYVNSGYALVGLAQYKEAAEAFLQAIDLRPEQANAYYGLAIALDTLGNRVGAMGAMYSFLHRAPHDDPYRRKAAAALWEWESQREVDKQSQTQLPGLLMGQESG